MAQAHASTEDEFGAVFEELKKIQAAGLMIAADPFFSSHVKQLAALSIHHSVPSVYQFREFAAAGGLLSYGTSFTKSFRTVGNYAGRILKGEKPADLPVQQATAVELIINQRTAETLGITMPQALISRADDYATECPLSGVSSQWARSGSRSKSTARVELDERARGIVTP